MNTKERLKRLRMSEEANRKHVEDWKQDKAAQEKIVKDFMEGRAVRLEATPERRAVWEACNKDCACSGCPARYKCERLFPTFTPWKTFVFPTDYTLEGDMFIITNEEENQ